MHASANDLLNENFFERVLKVIFLVFVSLKVRVLRNILPIYFFTCYTGRQSVEGSLFQKRMGKTKRRGIQK